MSELDNIEDENDKNHERSLIPANLFDDDDIMDNLNNDNLERSLGVSSSSTSSSSLGLLNSDIMDTSINPNSLTEPQNPSDENIPDMNTGVSNVYLEYRNNIINDLLNRGRIRLGSSRIIETDSNRSQGDNIYESGGGDFQIGGIPVSWTFDVEIDNSSNWDHRLHELRNIQIFNSLTPASIEIAISNGILNRFSNEHWSHYLNVLRDYVFNASPPRWERINTENNYVNSENHIIQQQQPSAILEQRTNGFNNSATTASNWPITWNPATMFYGLDDLIQMENVQNQNELPQAELHQIPNNNECNEIVEPGTMIPNNNECNEIVEPGTMIHNQNEMILSEEQSELENIDDDINTVIRELLLLNLNLWLDRQCSP